MEAYGKWHHFKGHVFWVNTQVLSQRNTLAKIATVSSDNVDILFCLLCFIYFKATLSETIQIVYYKHYLIILIK